jgi:hypothetical protein
VIRIDIDFDELEAAVDAAHPTWRVGATQANQRMWCSRPRNFDETGPSWSAVKAIYVSRQTAKCAYCERALETEQFGLIEHDIEHYRPKREVESWPHTSCARAFARLFIRDQAVAQAVYFEACDLLARTR